MTGMSSRVRNALVTRPPIMGAAMRFMTSAPAPVANSSGTRPISVVATVISLGRTRCTVPSMCAQMMSSSPRTRPAALRDRGAGAGGGREAQRAGVERAGNDALAVGDVAAEVALRRVDVEVEVAREERVLVAQHRRADRDPYVGDGGERDVGEAAR